MNQATDELSGSKGWQAWRGATRCRVLALMVATIAAPTIADLPPNDGNGGLSIVISLNYPNLIESGYLGVDAFTEERYCAIAAQASHHLWQVTERRHWFRRVDFRLGTTEADVNWSFVPSRTTSYGAYKNSILLYENYGSSSSPVNTMDPVKLAQFDEDLAWLLVHEMGHYLYDAKDEYVHGRTRNGTLGLCSDYAIGSCLMDPSIECTDHDPCAAANMGDTCDFTLAQPCTDDSQCLTGTCVLREPRTGEAGEASRICSDHDENATPGDFTECDDDLDCDGLTDADTGGDAVCRKSDLFHCTGLGNEDLYCWTDSDCQQGSVKGYCVREGEDGQPSTTKVCRRPDGPNPEEPSEPDWRNRTSSMASSGGGGRWCDEQTHRHKRWVKRWTSGGFDDEGVAWVSPRFTLNRPADYNTWERAACADHLQAADECEEHHPDLHVFEEWVRKGVYPPWPFLARSYFEDWIDFASVWDCDWNIDEVPVPGDNTVLLVDKSGSMDYEIGFDGAKKTAFEWAAEGALVVMEETDDANYTGIIAFDAGTDTIVDFQERGPLSIPSDPFDDLFAGVAPGGNTNLAAGILAATQAMAGMGPGSGKNIILMSDGENTVDNDPTALEAAQQACQQGIVVNTIAFGDANLTELEELAQVCKGQALISATENQLLEGEDAHILKSDFVRMRTLVRGETTLFEEVLGTLSNAEDVIEKSFFVPVDAGSLTFYWIGNEVPYCAQFDGTGENCIDPREVWSELTFELESPSQPFAGVRGSSYQALAHVSDPEPGWWTARVDASTVPISQSPRIREAARVSWLAVMDARDLRARAWIDEWRRPLNHPVLVNASLFFKAPLTDIAVEAHVTKQGVPYAPFPLFDDGAHGDGEAGDGTYGGWFNPDGNFFTTPGAYSVRVQFLSVEGISTTVTLESFEDDDAEAEPIVAKSLITQAETSFHLWPQYDCGSAQCPTPGIFNLPLGTVQQGASIPGVTAYVSELPLLDGRVAVELGPGVHVSNLSVLSGTGGPRGGGTGGPGGLDGFLMFDVTVDPDAKVGTHTASVWVGTRKLTAQFDVVCGEVDVGAPIIEATPVSVTTCELGPAPVFVPPPLTYDECSTGPVVLTGQVDTINGVPPVPSIAIDPANPVVDLPPGETMVSWQAMDVLGHVSSRRQRVDVELGTGCSVPAGVVPNGTQLGSQPLLVGKLADGRLHLDWERSCATTDLDYEVYEGQLGDFASHLPRWCSTGGATQQTMIPSAGSRYYLVVPANPFREGSYGVDGDGFERPPSGQACRPRSPGPGTCT